MNIIIVTDSVMSVFGLFAQKTLIIDKESTRYIAHLLIKSVAV